MTLKELRIKAGYDTAQAFADAAGIPNRRWKCVEDGKINFISLVIDETDKICKLLGVSKEEFFRLARRLPPEPPVKKMKMSKWELEAMLKEKFGDKLQPVKCSRKVLGGKGHVTSGIAEESIAAQERYEMLNRPLYINKLARCLELG